MELNCGNIKDFFSAVSAVYNHVNKNPFARFPNRLYVNQEPNWHADKGCSDEACTVVNTFLTKAKNLFYTCPGNQPTVGKEISFKEQKHFAINGLYIINFFTKNTDGSKTLQEMISEIVSNPAIPQHMLTEILADVHFHPDSYPHIATEVRAKRMQTEEFKKVQESLHKSYGHDFDHIISGRPESDPVAVAGKIHDTLKKFCGD